MSKVIHLIYKVSMFNTMFNRNNALPFVLALASTLAVLGLGAGILNLLSSTTASNNDNNLAREAKVSGNSSNSSIEAVPAISFSEPGIVPMGISVRINGSNQMVEVNKLLKKSFQQEFPGTTVNVDADGSETGMRLLRSGQIDLAAISRPLSDEERAEGLTAITLEGKSLEEVSASEPLLYVYREPANIKVEAFLGHLFSIKGQEVIIDHKN